METRRRLRGEVTVLQWTVISLLLALFAGVAIPGWLRSEGREHADRIRGELESIEKAVKSLALDQQIGEGTIVTFEDYRPYLTNRKRLAKSGTDPLGNPYGDQIVGRPPGVPEASRQQLADIVDDTFWEPYLNPDRRTDR